MNLKKYSQKKLVTFLDVKEKILANTLDWRNAVVHRFGKETLLFDKRTRRRLANIETHYASIFGQQAHFIEIVVYEYVYQARSLHRIAQQFKLNYVIFTFVLKRLKLFSQLRRLRKAYVDTETSESLFFLERQKHNVSLEGIIPWNELHLQLRTRERCREVESKYPDTPFHEVLFELYWEYGFSLQNIADEFGWTACSLNALLRKMYFPLRSKADAVRLSYKLRTEQ